MIEGTAVGTNGMPLSSVKVEIRDAAGNTSTDYTDSRGKFNFAAYSMSSLTGGGLTLTGTFYDSCQPSGGDKNVTGAPVPVTDGTLNATVGVPARTFCAADYLPSGTPDPSAHVDNGAGTILSRPGGTAVIEVTVPSVATATQVVLPDGTVLGTADSSDRVAITTPATPYDGPIIALVTIDGTPVAYPLGTLRSVAASRPMPATGRFDLAAIIDLSGSMSGNDPENRRLDATRLLIDLASPGDRLLAVGFDNDYRAVFPRTVITEAARAGLRAAARKNIGDFGSTDYNDGFENAYAQLVADPAELTVPKGAIFLTDGGHNSGPYDNGHLLFALNPSGASWPVCVVQLGRSFDATDVARLKRIARETGGQYLRAPDNTQLESLYFQCRGTASGAKTVLRRSHGFTVGQRRVYTSSVKAKQAKATFFVSWTEGRYRLALHQPGRKAPYTRSVGKRVRLVKGRTFQYFQVTAPRKGKWRLTVTRLASGDRVERATTSVNVQRRR